MVDNYINPNLTDGRVIDQSSRRVGGIFTTSVNNQAEKILSATCWIKADGSHTGNFQCHVYDHNGNQLTQIGSNVDINPLGASYEEKTFTATALQNTDSQFAVGQTGYIAFSISGSGQCTLGVQKTSSTLYDALPKKSVSTSNPYTFISWDNGDKYYFKGTVSFGTFVPPVGLTLPPPIARIRL